MFSVGIDVGGFFIGEEEKSDEGILHKRVLGSGGGGKKQEKFCLMVDDSEIPGFSKGVLELLQGEMAQQGRTLLKGEFIHLPVHLCGRKRLVDCRNSIVENRIYAFLPEYLQTGILE